MAASFKSKRAKAKPAISTASLPDIIFILLFFFMVVTVIRELTPMVKNTLPEATEVDPLGKKSTVIHIMIGAPEDPSLGTSDRIQIDDAFIEPEQVGIIVREKIVAMLPEEQPFAKVNIKEDIKSQVGILTDVKQELRKVNARRIVYATRPGRVE